MKWNVELNSNATKQFLKLDKSIRMLVSKKLTQLELKLFSRHMKKGLPFFVEEVGQYRIAFEEGKDLRTIQFIGTHKEYKKWYLQ